MAVFVSFVSLVEPVQAARMDTGVEASAASERASACTTAMLVGQLLPRREVAETAQRATRCGAVAMGFVPPVRLQADRARE